MLASKTPGELLVERVVEIVPQVAAGASERDRKRILPHDEIRMARQAGVHTATVPKEFGGPNATFVQLAKIISILASGDPNVSQSFLPHLAMLDILRAYGSDRQRRRWFDRVMSGTLFGTAYSERGTKHAMDMKTTVRKTGSTYRVDGKKFYCTGCAFSDYIFAPAVNDDGQVVMTVFSNKAPGVTVVDDWDAMGQRTTASGTVELKGVEVDPDDMISLHGFGGDRSFVGAGAQLRHASIDVGIAMGALRDAIEYGRTKARPSSASGVSTVAEDPYVLHTMGEIAVMVHAAEAMLERGGASLDRGVLAQGMKESQRELADQILGEASIAVAEAKAMANKASLFASQSMFQIGGASMGLGAYNLDRHWRNARIHTIHDPISYKYREIGGFHLAGTLPPIYIYS